MKRSHPAIAFAGLLLFITGQSALSAEPDKPLRYAFDPQKTNAYRIEIDMQGEAGKESVAGTFVTWVTPAGSNFFTVSIKGQFQMVAQSNRAPMMYRPGFVPLSSLLSGHGYGMHQNRELTIDDHGRVARITGDLLLPTPFGTLLTVLFPELPPDAQEKWESSGTAYVMEDPILMGPAVAFLQSPYGFAGPYMPGRSPQGPLAVKFAARNEIKEASEQTVLIETKKTLDSFLVTGDEPRVSSSADVRYVLDRNTGTPRSVEWSGKSLLATEHVTKRTTVSFRANVLEGAQLAEAIKPPPAPKTPEEQKLSPQELRELIKSMESTDSSTRIKAANDLSSRTVDQLDDWASDKLAALASDKEDYIRRAALRILAMKPRPNDLPVLIRGMSEEDSSLKQGIVRGIASLKSPRAAGALAEIIASGPSDPSSGFMQKPSEAAEALAGFGPVAESAALPLLKEKNARTLIDACHVLRETGSNRSMQELTKLVAHPSKNVSEAAAAAIRAIQGRNGRAPGER